MFCLIQNLETDLNEMRGNYDKICRDVSTCRIFSLTGVRLKMTIVF